MRNPLWSIRKRLARLKAFPAVARVDGAAFLLDPGNWIDNRLIAGVPYEREQLAAAADLIHEHDVRQVIDIGANFGLYTVMLGRLEAVERVDAFEPVQRNFNQMCGNIFANRLDGKVTAHCLALGAETGVATIHIDPASTGVSRLDLASAGRDSAVFSQSETIRIVRGDDVLSVSGMALYLKIDVEGHAPAVIEGMARTLAGNHGAMQVEIDSNDAEVVSRLQALGWTPERQAGNDRYYVKDP